MPVRWLTGMLLVVGLGAVSPSPAWAVKDWNRTDDAMTHAVGLHVGKIGGTGLAFVVPATWYIHVQVAGGVWNNQDDHRYNVGGEVHWLLRQDPVLRLYLVTGLALYAHDQRVARDDGSTEWDLDQNLNAGFGVGIERLIGDRWSLKADLDFTYEGEDDGIRPWPQLGLLFYW